MGGRSGVSLTPRQARFVDEYLIDFNGTQAAIRAGYSPKTAESQAWRLLRNAKVKAAVEAGKEKRHTSAVMSATEALERATVIARLDIREFFWGDGMLKPVSEWTPEMGAQASRLEVIIKNAEAGDGHTDTVHKLAFHDVHKALEFLGRHHGVFAAEKLDMTLTVEVSQRLEAGRLRVAEAAEQRRLIETQLDAKQ